MALVDRIVEDSIPRAGLESFPRRVASNFGLDSEIASATRCAWVSLSASASRRIRSSISAQHGYWIPMTILFVLRPGYGETLERIAMRAAGTVLGLLIATPTR